MQCPQSMKPAARCDRRRDVLKRCDSVRKKDTEREPNMLKRINLDHPKHLPRSVAAPFGALGLGDDPH